MAKSQKGLGKGLSALFVQTEIDFGKAGMPEIECEKVGDVLELEISNVFPNPNQPRKVFEEGPLMELADSISAHGVIMPIVVTGNGDGTFMIIAGERRWRASQLAGKKVIPAIVKNFSEKQVKEVSLIENLQREDLNPIEAAVAMKQLMEDYGMTQENLAERLGKSRSTIANTLRLLQLSPDVITLISEGKLTAGHARALITLPENKQLYIAKQAVNNGLSVREVEQKVRDYFNPPELIKKKKREKMLKQSVELRDLIERMQRTLATKVSAIGNDNKGRIYIDYYTRDDLDRLSDFIELARKQAEKDLYNEEDF